MPRAARVQDRHSHPYAYCPKPRRAARGRPRCRRRRLPDQTIRGRRASRARARVGAATVHPEQEHAAVWQSRTGSTATPAHALWPADCAHEQRIWPAGISDEPGTRGRDANGDHRARLGFQFRQRHESCRGLHQPTSPEAIQRGNATHHPHGSRRRVLHEGAGVSRGISIRLRMLILFCTVVGTLLALTFTGFYLVFERAVRGQLDRRLQEMAAPIIADLIMDPDEKDVDQLNIDEQYFEVLDASGHVAQRSKNLQADLPLTQMEFQSTHIPAIGDIRIASVPFEAGSKRWTLIAASSTRETEAAVTTLRNFALLL